MSSATLVLMTPKGKIARSPRNIREILNSRLENGEPGSDIVLRLNTQPTQPQVRSILTADFQGRATTGQNLSDSLRLHASRSRQNRT